MGQQKKKVSKIIVDVILWLFLIFSMVITVLAFTSQANSDGVPKIGDKYILTVSSDSMATPTGFQQGDIIICKELSDEEKKTLRERNVITFFADIDLEDGKDEKSLNTHRIIEIVTNSNGDVVGYRTKGDNNLVADENMVALADIRAIWTGTRIPLIGAFIAWLQTSTGFLICIVIPLFLFFIYELYVLIKVIIAMKNKGTKQITAADEELIKQRAVEEYLRQQAAEKAEEAPTEEPAEKKDTWTCPACGCKDITSKFCPECGAKKPE